jgi:hypothetical protein
MVIQNTITHSQSDPQILTAYDTFLRTDFSSLEEFKTSGAIFSAIHMIQSNTET